MKHPFARSVSFALVVCLAISMMCTSANAQDQAGQGKYVIVTDGSTIDGNQYIQAVRNGLEAYIHEKGLSDDAYGLYMPDNPGADAKEAKIREAIDDGATVILLAGFLWGKGDIKIVKNYPEVCFLSFEWEAKSYPSNMINLTFAEEISGFLAGYAVVMAGYRQLGFLGGSGKNAQVIRYGYGYMQGANYAATQLDTPVSMRYWYSGSYSPSEEIQAKMEEWYAEGTEIVFSCGGSIIQSCITAAEENNALVVGVDQDCASYSDTVLTSACKLYDQAVIYMLNLYNPDVRSWPTYITGSSIRLSLAEHVVGLPTNDQSWRFTNFAVSDYQQILIDIANGSIAVKDGTSRPKVKMLKVSFEK